jgi:hypothetical protein
MLTRASEQAGEAEHVAEELQYVGQFLYSKPPDDAKKRKRKRSRVRKGKNERDKE